MIKFLPPPFRSTRADGDFRGVAGPVQWLLLVFVGGGVLVGGAGHAYPLATMVIELVAIVLLLSVLLNHWPLATDRWAWAVAAGIAALAVWAALQMVPLPYAMWSALPGHATAAAVDHAVGWRQMRGISLVPDENRLALAKLLPPFAAFVATAGLDRAARARLMMWLAMLALATAMLGVAQIAFDLGGSLFPFATAHIGFGIGLFVNRNHQACWLLAMIPVVAIAIRRARWLGSGPGSGRRPERGSEGSVRKGLPPAAIAVAACAVMAIGVIATGSRTALVLLPVVLVLTAAQGVPRRREALLAAVAAAIVIPVVLWLPPVQLVLARFATVSDDGRLTYWRNARLILPDVLPWGDGLGSFRALYAATEPLAQVQPLYVEHAHNELLEWAIEGGVPLLALAAFLVIATLLGFRRAVNAAGADGVDRATAGAALTGLAAIAAFCLVDFPLRMTGLAMVAGVLAALALPLPVGRAGGGLRGWRAAVAIGLGLVAGWQTVQAGLAQALVARGEFAWATTVAPWYATGWTALGQERQQAGDQVGASAAAQAALRIAPLDPAALRIAGLANAALGQQRHGAEELAAAAQLGWRDPLTQGWVADQALAQGDPVDAAQAIDALLRQGVPPTQLYRVLGRMMANPPGVAAIATRLADWPGWRQGFFNALADTMPGGEAATEQLAVRLRGQAAAVTPVEMRLVRWRLADAGKFAEVYRLWRLSGAAGYGADIPMGVPPVRAAPFEWAAPPLPGVRVSAIPGGRPGSPRSAIIATDGIASGAAMTQALALPPGDYRIGLTAQTSVAAKLPLLSVTCLPAPATAQPLPVLWRRDASANLAGQTSMKVEPDCPGQVLSISVPDSDGLPFVVTIGGLRIEK